MTEPKPLLLIAESDEFSKEALAALRRHFAVELANLNREELLQRVSRCQYLWVRLRTLIDAEIIDAAPQLKAIVTNTTGLNHIELDHAQRRGILIISLQGELNFLKTIRATAEHTIGLTLALLRKIPAAHDHVCNASWDRSAFKGREIYGKTVGIVGYGRLGKIVAGYFQALGATVIVNDRGLAAGETVDGFATKPLPALLSIADIVSLHVAYEPSNRRMLGASEFRAMKPGAVFINTARGELVDETALLEDLEREHLGGAALDVIDAEHGQSPVRARLVQFARVTDRLILTPHIGGYTDESLARTEIFLADKLLSEVLGIPTS